VAVGPGTGRSKKLTVLVRWLYENVTAPLVIDADGLNALAHGDDKLARPGGARVVTPHPGEFARLLDVPDGASREQQVELARLLAAERQIIVVLKGSRTAITDGSRVAINETGNPGMASGGTGDVLTGVITALVCQGLTPLDAAILGTHVHGKAGDLAAAELGQVSLIARDLITYLPQAFLSVQ
jgi:NAD(P)H-hydrate epimerase